MSDIEGSTPQPFHEEVGSKSQEKKSKLKKLEWEKLQTKQRDYRNRRNRIEAIIGHWRKKIPQYYVDAVRQNTSDEMCQPLMWLFDGDFKEDIKDSAGLNPRLVLDFLDDHKIIQRGQSRGSYRSYHDMRKLRDAIYDGAHIRGECLSPDFHEEIEEYLRAYKRYRFVQICADAFGTRKDGHHR